MKTHSCFTVLKLHMLHLKLMLNKKKTPRKETVSGQGPRPFLLLNTPASVLHERGGGGGDKRQEKKESRSEQARRAQQL